MSCFLSIHCIFGLFTFVSGIWSQEVDLGGRSQAEYVQRKWITQLMDEAKRGFDLDSTVNEKCQSDFRLYKLHLANQSIWAIRNIFLCACFLIWRGFYFYLPLHPLKVYPLLPGKCLKVLESSEWPSVGLYAGTTYSLGNWDECLRVAQYDIKGQYCLVEANFDWTEDSRKIVEHVWSDEKASVWDALGKYKKMPWLSDRQNLHWALCIPASCQPSEIALSLNQTLRPIFENQGMRIQIHVEANLCSQRIDSRTFSKGFFIFCGLAALLLAFVIYATVQHQEVQRHTDYKSNQLSRNYANIIESFSVFHNLELLTKHSSESAYVHGWRIFHMILCAVGHRIFLFLTFPKFNIERKELSFYRNDDFGLHFRILYLVDIFCIFSGFFICHNGSSRKNFGFMLVILRIIRRWLRVVPVFAIVILFTIHVFPNVGEGPFWNNRVGEEVENCKVSFWYFIFGVNNIFETDKFCFFTSWYVAVDLQSVIIGEILLYLISRNRSLGIFATIALFLSSTIACTIILYVNEYHAFMQINDRTLSQLRQLKEYTNFYIKPYHKLPMFLLGFISAFLMHNTRLRHYEVTNKAIVIWMFFCILMKSLVMIYVKQFFDFVEPYNRLKHALNLFAPRFIFFIPDCCFLIMCFAFTGKAKYFNPHLFTIVGRLMYSFYVVHVVLMVFQIASSQVLIPTTDLSTSWIFGGDLCYSLVAAFFLYLFIEAPISNLVSIWSQKFSRRNSADDSKKGTIAVNGTATISEENKIKNH